jgi:hypothetical protein
MRNRPDTSNPAFTLVELKYGSPKTSGLEFEVTARDNEMDIPLESSVMPPHGRAEVDQ